MNNPIGEWYYAYGGVSVTSQLELPEWESFTMLTPPQAADVALRVATPLTSAECVTPSLQADTTTLSFLLPKVGHYCIDNGRAIVMQPCTEVDVSELRLFLLGSAWGALGYQRGWFPLHASIVQIGEGAVAFCAPSGGGKSSLAAWLVKGGYALVSDDLCRLDVMSTQPPCIWRSTPRLKLWQDALTVLRWQDQRLNRDQSRVDKYHMSLSKASAHQATCFDTLPLRAIYVLAWGPLAIEPLTGLHAVRTVLETASYRPEFVKALGQTARYWQQAIALVGQTPVFCLRRPRDWTAMPEVGKRLLDHVQKI